MSGAFDKLLSYLKWPVAVISVILIPGTSVATWGVLSSAFENPSPVLPLLLGALGYSLAWLLIFRKAAWGTWFSTLEHELTHVLFAQITFHKVKAISVTDNDGGSMSYESQGGDGNWLIVISPYFFPTFSIGLLIVLALTAPDKQIYPSACLGVSMAYHVISNWKQLHKGQTDLQLVGFRFAWIFLPNANLMCYVGILLLRYLGLERSDASNLIKMAGSQPDTEEQTEFCIKQSL